MGRLAAAVLKRWVLGLILRMLEPEIAEIDVDKVGVLGVIDEEGRSLHFPTPQSTVNRGKSVSGIRFQEELHY